MVRSNAGLIPSKKIIAFIKEQEGFNPRPYVNNFGEVAIGYGSIRYEDDVRVHIIDEEIDEEYANYLLQLTLLEYADCVINKAEHPMEQHQFDALLSFAFTIGCHSFNASALMTAFNKDPQSRDIALQFVKWNKVKNRFHKKLAIRRQIEANIYFYGEEY